MEAVSRVVKLNGRSLLVFFLRESEITPPSLKSDVDRQTELYHCSLQCHLCGEILDSGRPIEMFLSKSL